MKIIQRLKIIKETCKLTLCQDFFFNFQGGGGKLHVSNYKHQPFYNPLNKWILLQQIMRGWYAMRDGRLKDVNPISVTLEENHPKLQTD